MQIDPGKTYQIHKALMTPGAREAGEQLARVVLNPEQLQEFLTARDRAGTAGPIMIAGRISTLPGDKVAQVFDKGLVTGARPCWVDNDGNVLMGEYVFVPVPD